LRGRTRRTLSEMICGQNSSQIRASQEKWGQCA
jgi:hypothetical protein